MHLLHDSRAVGFDRLLADPQLAGDLLVKPAGDDECEHLRLAWRESRDPSFDLGDPGSLVQIADILLDGPTHRFQQNIGAIGLSDEIHRARLHRADASRDVTVPSDEDDRHGLLALGERCLQLQPRESRHLDIEHQATGSVARRLLQEVHARREALHLIACRRQQPRKALPNGRAVVDDIDDGPRRHHPVYSGAAGRLNVSVTPAPVLFSARSWPPCASIREREIERPIPSP